MIRHVLNVDVIVLSFWIINIRVFWRLLLQIRRRHSWKNSTRFGLKLKFVHIPCIQIRHFSSGFKSKEQKKTTHFIAPGSCRLQRGQGGKIWHVSRENVKHLLYWNGWYLCIPKRKESKNVMANIQTRDPFKHIYVWKCIYYITNSFWSVFEIMDRL